MTEQKFAPVQLTFLDYVSIDGYYTKEEMVDLNPSIGTLCGFVPTPPEKGDLKVSIFQPCTTIHALPKALVLKIEELSEEKEKPAIGDLVWVAYKEISEYKSNTVSKFEEFKDHNCQLMNTVGVLIHSDSTKLVVAHQFDDGSKRYRHGLVIPKKGVKKVSKLTAKPVRKKKLRRWM